MEARRKCKITEEEFHSIIDLLEQDGLGKQKVMSPDNQTGKKMQERLVFYKKPPDQVADEILSKQRILPTQYKLAYGSRFKVAPIRFQELEHPIDYMASVNSFTMKKNW